jgi:hypothetical protein
MHWRDLRASGENEQRLYSLDAWREDLAGKFCRWESPQIQSNDGLASANKRWHDETAFAPVLVKPV